MTFKIKIIIVQKHTERKELQNQIILLEELEKLKNLNMHDFKNY